MSGNHPGPGFEGPADGPSHGRTPGDDVPDFSGPAAPEPEFRPCYRHPDRNTGITCQRCHRPICMQCMHDASVGFQCPDCVGAGQRDVRQPRPTPAAGRIGQRLQVGATPVTWAIVGLGVLVGLVDLVSRGLGSALLALSGNTVLAGQWWRLLTYGIVPSGLLSLAVNALVLVLVGRSLEPLLGRWRYAAVYLTACLVGAALFVVVSQASPFGVPGMATGVIGLIAASGAVKLRMGLDIKMDLVLLGLLVALSLIAGFSSFYWLVQVGGVLGGGGAALIMLFAPHRNRSRVQAIGLGAVWAVCAAAIGLTTLLA